jgi:hypothetical protein
VGDTLRMLGRVRRGRVHLSVTGPMGITMVDQYRLSPGLGWALVSPIPRPVGRDAPVLSMLWVAMLWVPFGYYTRTARGEGTRKRVGLLGAAGATAAGIGLLVAPMMSEMPIPGPAEWVGLAGGILFGAMLSVVVRRLYAAYERAR